MPASYITEDINPQMIALIVEMANGLMAEFETHQPLIDYKIRIDYIIALAGRNETGDVLCPAIMHHGHPANGLCRIVSLKDRAKGNGDVEILLDGDWWGSALPEEQRALLDHELHHIEVMAKNGVVMTDDLNRPKIELRKHDHQLGFFDIIAARHGKFSQECQQAQEIRDGFGDLYWPTGETSPIIRSAKQPPTQDVIEGV